jgi:hypothetical protein
VDVCALHSVLCSRDGGSVSTAPVSDACDKAADWCPSHPTTHPVTLARMPALSGLRASCVVLQPCIRPSHPSSCSNTTPHAHTHTPSCITRPPRLCTDNGVMVAVTGALRLAELDAATIAALPPPLAVDISPRWPIGAPKPVFVGKKFRRVPPPSPSDSAAPVCAPGEHCL